MAARQSHIWASASSFKLLYPGASRLVVAAAPPDVRWRLCPTETMALTILATPAPFALAHYGA
jgi:hypothetical protein